MNYNSQRLDLFKHSEFINYVDTLKLKYSIRIEVHTYSVVNINSLDAVEECERIICEYLKNTLHKNVYENQLKRYPHRLHHVWFTHNEDALAFMLKFNGSVV